VNPKENGMPAAARLLRIYTDEAAYFGDRKVFEVIAMRAREHRLAGATVIKALIGFGHTAHMHTRHILDDDQSIVIEIVDDEDRLRRFVELISDLPEIGLITLEAIEVLLGGRTPTGVRSPG
jgi:PII-like signaling protein